MSIYFSYKKHSDTCYDAVGGKFKDDVTGVRIRRNGKLWDILVIRENEYKFSESKVGYDTLKNAKLSAWLAYSADYDMWKKTSNEDMDAAAHHYKVY